MSTKIVGFTSEHDASYCILEDGVPIIHEQMERITRVKMQHGDGLKFFFSRINDAHDIKYFTFGNWGFRSGNYEKDYFDQASDDKMRDIISENEGAYFEFGHHTSHAANGFYTSNFDDALIITLDAWGWEPGHFPTSLTINEGLDNKIRRVKTFKDDEADLGGMYSRTIEHIFGLSTGFPRGDQSGTVMAMATVGKPKYTNLFSEFNKNLDELRCLAKMSEQEGFNVAASLQKHFEQTFCDHVTEYINRLGHTNLCLSGGASLNCVMVGKIKRWFPKIKNIFCDPVPFDGGLSLGSARYLWHHVLGNPRIKNQIKNQSPYLGRTYNKGDLLNACSQFSGKIAKEQVNDKTVLHLISEQSVVAIFGGGSESGRRALGNRSIIADPRNPDMKRIMNKVKHRLWFRPIAPVILEEKTGEWFDNPISSPYMSFALKFKEDKKESVPAVVHFDGTGRLQTVSKSLNPWFHGFISKWEKISSVPILINTSFNDNEPIVETPTDALLCFLKTNIDYLYFFEHHMLISKLKGEEPPSELKNILIYLSPNKKISNKISAQLKAQIDNSLKYWQAADIILVTNFPFKYHRIKAIISDKHNKIEVIYDLLEGERVRENEFWWYHDNNIFQTQKLDLPVITLADTTAGYVCSNPLQNIFFRPGSSKIFEWIINRANRLKCDPETALQSLIDQNYRGFNSMYKKLVPKKVFYQIK